MFENGSKMSNQEQETPQDVTLEENEETTPNVTEAKDGTKVDTDREEESQVVSSEETATNQVAPLAYDNTIEHHFDLNQNHLSYRTRHLHRITDSNGAVISNKVHERSGIVANLKYDIYMNEKNKVANTNYRLLQIESTVDPITGQETSNIKHQIGEPHVQILQKREQPYVEQVGQEQQKRYKSVKHINLGGEGSKSNLIEDPRTVILDTGIKLEDLNRAQESDLKTSSGQESDLFTPDTFRRRKTKKARNYHQFQTQQNGHVPGFVARADRDLEVNDSRKGRAKTSREEFEEEVEEEQNVELRPHQLSIFRMLLYSFMFTVLLAIVVYLALPRLIPMCCNLQKSVPFFNEMSLNDDKPLPH